MAHAVDVLGENGNLILAIHGNDALQVARADGGRLFGQADDARGQLVGVPEQNDQQDRCRRQKGHTPVQHVFPRP